MLASANGRRRPSLIHVAAEDPPKPWIMLAQNGHLGDRGQNQRREEQGPGRVGIFFAQGLGSFGRSLVDFGQHVLVVVLVPPIAAARVPLLGQVAVGVVCGTVAVAPIGRAVRVRGIVVGIRDSFFEPDVAGPVVFM